MKTIISLLSGDIENVDGVWRSQKWQHLRVAAAACLAQKNERGEYSIFAQGGYASEGRPSLSHVMREELIGLGVPQTHIVEEDRSISTYRQLIELQEYIAQEPVEMVVQIVSSNWHLPRIGAMLGCVSELSRLAARKPELVAAESVLLGVDSNKWQPVIDATHDAEDMPALLAKEEQGVSQIRSGTYNFR